MIEKYFYHIRIKFKLGLLLLLVVIAAYGLTLGMYIWQDDNAIMFKLQHLSEGMGNLGTGIFDRNTPYRGVMVPLVPLYYLFGLEPVGYFATGLIVYFLATLIVYFLSKELSDDHQLALGAALIFAAGYVGGETLWRIYNSIHTVLNIIFISLSLLFYTKFIKKGSVIKYLLSLLFFWIAMETGYVRAHGIIFLILSLEFIFNFKIIKSFFKVLPFSYLYYIYYLQTNASSGPVRSFMNKIFIEGNIELVLAPFITLKNIIIPDVINVPDWLFLLVLFALLIFKRSKLLWFSVVFMMQSYLVPYVHNQGQIFASLHRYVILSLVGLSLFYSELFKKFFSHKKAFYIAIFLIVISHLYLIDKEQLRIVEHIGKPTRKFFSQLKEELPTLPKNSAIYFEVADDPESNNQFYNFFGVGSMPETTAIAIYYGVDRYDLYLPATFNELLSLLKNKKTDQDKIFTFYYDAFKGLTNTTDLTRKSLFGDKKEQEIKNLSNIDYDFSAPLFLKLTLNSEVDETKINYNKASKINLINYFKYFESRKSYYSEVIATASSQWKYQEVSNLTDNSQDTSWMAHRGDWHYNRKESIWMDLKNVKNIGAIKLTTRTKGKSPSDYKYFCSIDGITWKVLDHYYINTSKDYQPVVNKFVNSDCRFVRMDIKNTSGEDEPQLSELEVIESEYRNLDLDQAIKVLQDPFSYLKSDEDKNLLLDFLSGNGIDAKICILTNKKKSLNDSNCQPLKVMPNKQGDYEVVLQPSGTMLQKIELKTFPEIKINVIRGIISTLSFEQLKDMNLIYDYSQN